MEKTEGLVIEVNEHHMVVMCDDGLFRNLPLPVQLPRIGERVTADLTARRKPSFISRTGRWTRMMSAAAVLLLVFISAAFFYGMGQEQAFGMVNVDINPSVNLYFDEKGMIIKVDALNEDGEKITESLNLEDKPIVQAIPLIWESALSEGYLHDDRENAMMVSVVPLKSEQERQAAMQAYAEQIKQELRAGWEQQGITGYIEVLAVDITVKEAAEKTKISVNKYILQQEAFSRGMAIQDDELNSSIYEIVNKGNLRQLFEKIDGEEKKDKPNHAPQRENSGSDRDSNNNEERKPDKYPKEQDTLGKDKAGSKNEDIKRETPVKKESEKRDGKMDNPSPNRNDKPDKPKPKSEAESKVQQEGTPQSGVPTVDFKRGEKKPDSEPKKDDESEKEDAELEEDRSDRDDRKGHEKKENKDNDEDSDDDSEDNEN